MKELCACICAYHLTSMPACPVQENQVQSCSGGGHVFTPCSLKGVDVGEY